MLFVLFLEPALVAKSSILLDVKPWDDETDMAKLEECVRSIQADGLVWGSCEFGLYFLKIASGVCIITTFVKEQAFSKVFFLMLFQLN